MYDISTINMLAFSLRNILEKEEEQHGVKRWVMKVRLGGSSARCEALRWRTLTFCFLFDMLMIDMLMIDMLMFDMLMAFGDEEHGGTERVGER